MTPFPLLCLSSVPLGNTLKCFDPIELYTLSQCSTKTVEKIHFSGSRNFHLSVDFGFKKVMINNQFVIRVVQKCSEKAKKYEEIGYRSFGVKDKKMTVSIALNPDYENELISFWDDIIIGLGKICIHLSKIFGCKIESFISDNSLSPEKFQSIIKEILETQTEIQKLAKVNFTDNNLKWTLDTVKVTEVLEIHSELNQTFSYSFKTLPKVLIINQSSWITLTNLLSFNSCVYISLTRSKLTNQDLDVFVNQWKHGNYPKLEYLSVRSENLNDKKPIGGLTVLDNTWNPTYKEKMINNYNCSIIGGVDIQRNDGIMGTIRLDIEFNRLLLLVWL